MDKIHDGLGLAEVEASVQESAFAELAGLGGTAAAREEILENFLRDEGVAVARDLEGVLAGKRIRPREKSEQHVVHERAARIAVVGMPGRAGQGSFAENPIHQRGSQGT